MAKTITLTDKNDKKTGSSADEKILAKGGNDSVDGGAGKDTLDGGSGNDKLTGGADNDTLIGGDGSDTAIYAGALEDKNGNRLYDFELNDKGQLLVIDLSKKEGVDTVDSVEFLKFKDQTVAVSDIIDELTATPPVLTLDPTNQSVNEGTGGDPTELTFDLSLSSPSNQPVSVHVSTQEGTAKPNSDYIPLNQVITFDPGETDQTITVSIAADSVKEGTEQFTIKLDQPQGLEIDGNGVATIGIIDDDSGSSSQVGIQVSDVKIAEGNTGSKTATVTVSLTGSSSNKVTVDYATLDGSATAGSDYQSKSGTLTFNPGETKKTINITINGDTQSEGDETFSLNLSNPQGAKLNTAKATITIQDDDGGVQTTSNLPPIAKDDTFGNLPTDEQVIKTGADLLKNDKDPDGDPLTVTKVSDANGGVVSLNDKGQIIFTPSEGAQSGGYSYTVNDGKGGSATATVKLGFMPTLSIADLSQKEGNSKNTLLLTVQLSAPSSQAVSVDYTTLDNTAIAGLDYQDTSGTLTIPAGQTSQTLSIPILGDTAVESDETFLLRLSNPLNAALALSEATITLLNDDSAGSTPTPPPNNGNLPLLSIANLSVTEGNSGKSNAILTVSLSSASSQAVTVNYLTVDGTAQAGSDYAGAIGSLSFAPGEISKTLSIPVLGDTREEPDETFQVQLTNPSGATLNSAQSTATVTIANDDIVIPTLSISSTSVIEGNTGITNANLTVQLSSASSQPVTVNYTTADGTAVAGSDYAGTAGLLTFAAGETSKTLTIPVLGETTFEADETIKVSLFSPANATLSATSANATLTIKNDDVSSSSTSTTYTPGQEVIDLGPDYGKLIKPVNVDGHWYYYWDRSGDGTSANTQGNGYTNIWDTATHDWLDSLFRQDINGVTGGGGNTSNTYRYAMLNGVNVALPTAGEATLTTGGRPGTVIGVGPDGEINPTYDDLLAIWDAYNGGGTETNSSGVPSGWGYGNLYWSATPSTLGHAVVNLSSGVVYDSDDSGGHLGYYVALEVL